MKTRAPKNGQAGQAMVEFAIVAALVLVPLFLAIPVIGKYLDVRAAAANAARYAAWERSVWYGGASAAPIGYGSAIGWGTNSWQSKDKTDAQIAKEVAVRIFSDTGDAGFGLADVNVNASNWKGPRTLWYGRNGVAMLANYSDVGNSVGNSAAPGTMNKILDPIVEIAALLGPFTLEMKGEYTATVKVKLKDFDRTTFLPTGANIQFAEANVLLANGWNAGGPDAKDVTSVKTQVAGLTPTSIFQKAKNVEGVDVMNIIQTILMIPFPELSSNKLDLGKIEPDVVPADRLQ